MIFVIIQFSCLGFLLLYKNPINNTVSLVFILLGLVLGLWAIYAMRLEHLSVTPNVNSRTKLTSKGPYALIRHPMYTSLFVFVIAACYANPLPEVIAGGLILSINLILKLRYEEKKLLEVFEDYSNYMKRTYRLIPYIY